MSINIEPKALEEIHASLKPISERSPMADCQALARLNMRLIESLLGKEEKTELPKRHHE